MSDMMAGLEGMLGEGMGAESPETQRQEPQEGIYENNDGEAAIFVTDLNDEITLKKFKDLEKGKQNPVFNAIFGRDPKGSGLSKNERIAVEVALEAVPVWEPMGPAPDGMDTTREEFDEGIV